MSALFPQIYWLYCITVICWWFESLNHPVDRLCLPPPSWLSTVEHFTSHRARLPLVLGALMRLSPVAWRWLPWCPSLQKITWIHESNVTPRLLAHLPFKEIAPCMMRWNSEQGCHFEGIAVKFGPVGKGLQLWIENCLVMLTSTTQKTLCMFMNCTAVLWNVNGRNTNSFSKTERWYHKI